MEEGLPRNKSSGDLFRTAMKGGECMGMPEMDEGQLHEFKKKLGLPVKKGLVYMKKLSYMKFEPVPVVDIAVVGEYSDSCTLEIITETGETVRIHSAYFAQMQQVGFAERMKRQMEQQEGWT